MTLTKKTFTVELTTQEIEVITRALHGEYKFIREDIDKNNLTSAKRQQRYQDQLEVRTIRNEFASLINTHYMGEDA